MDKQNTVYLYNGILFSHKKKWSIDTCYNTHEPCKYYAKVQEASHKGPSIEWFHSYAISGIGKSIEIKSRLGGFPGGAVVKNPPANAGDMGSSPGPGRSHMLQSN